MKRYVLGAVGGAMDSLGRHWVLDFNHSAFNAGKDIKFSHSHSICFTMTLYGGGGREGGCTK